MSKKYHGILHLCLPISKGGVRDLLTEYLDETTKPSYESPEAAEARIGREKYAEALADGRAPRRPGIEYFPLKGNRIKVFGHLVSKLAHYFPDPNAAPQEALVERLIRIWNDAATKYENKGIHAVFSVHKSVSAEMARRGGSIDAPLLSSLASSMEAFAARFYPGDSLGWAAAVHHDRSHDHVHTLIFPLTARGKRVNFSGGARVLGADGATHRADHLGMAKLLFFEECGAVDRALFEPETDGLGLCLAKGEIVTAVAARHHLSLNGGGRSTPGDFESMYGKCERLEGNTLEAYRVSIAGTRNLIEPGLHFPSTLNSLAAMKRDILEQIERCMARAGSIHAARNDAICPLYDFDGPDERAGYCRHKAIHSAANALALTAEQSGRLKSYRQAVDTAAVERAKEPSTTATLIRTSLALCQGASLGGWAHGKPPAFAADPTNIVYGTLADAKKRFDEKFADILAAKKFALRPFSVGEFGDRPLSPYQVARRKIREDVSIEERATLNGPGDPFADHTSQTGSEFPDLPHPKSPDLGMEF